jgi:tight adherence protein C
MPGFLIASFILVGLLLSGGLVFGLMAMRRHRARLRLEAGDRPAYPTGETYQEEEDDELPEHRYFLRRWLSKAGYRRPLAPAIFVLWTIAALSVGIVLASVASATGVFRRLAFALVDIPGDFAELLAPVLQVGPWLLLILAASAPIVHVRSKRRKLAEDVERELPLVLELLSTLARSGLGFDAAVTRLAGEDRGVPTVAREFEVFQRETLSGVPRVRCLRRMAERVDVPTFSTFISSLVQAERSGFGLGDVLRHQADDLRNRRREKALMKAQALPVKLVFPLVLCFLPALFVLTLGPAFYTFFQLTDSVTRTIK